MHRVNAKTIPFTRSTIKIPSATPGWNLDAWTCIPKGSPCPVIVMGHGLGCNKLMGLSEFAEAFASAGYACVVFDYRRWGQSDGTRRDSVFISEQLEDYRTVIRYVRDKREEYDSRRVVLWGFSFSGGHVMTLSAEADLNVAATIAISPYGGRPFPFMWKIQYFKLLFLGLWDLLKQVLGLAPAYIPTAGNPGEVASQAKLRSIEGFYSVAKDPRDFPNRIAASIFLRAPFYKANNVAHKIKCPIFFIAPRNDTIRSFQDTVDVSKIPPRAELLEVSGGHFDMFYDHPDWNSAIRAQLDFLAKALSAAVPLI